MYAQFVCPFPPLGRKRTHCIPLTTRGGLYACATRMTPTIGGHACVSHAAVLHRAVRCLCTRGGLGGEVRVLGSNAAQALPFEFLDGRRLVWQGNSIATRDDQRRKLLRWLLVLIPQPHPPTGLRVRQGCLVVAHACMSLLLVERTPRALASSCSATPR